MMNPRLVTPPATPFVSLADAKAQCRIVGTEDDAYLAGLIAAAMSDLDGWGGALGRCIQRQTWSFGLPGFWDVPLLFPHADSDSVVVEYVDETAAMQVLASASYAVTCNRLLFKSCPSTLDGSEVTVTADYGYAPGAEPAALRQAVLMLVSFWNENREGQGGFPPAVESIIRKFRMLDA